MIRKTRRLPEPALRVLLLALLALLAPLSLPPLAAPDDPAPAAAGAAAKIDINRAGVAELQSLKGVGPALARRIVEYRNAEGPFERIEDLLQVKGVGPKLLDRIRARVVVKPATKKTR